MLERLHVANWFRKPRESGGLLSLCPGARGISAAFVRRATNDQPVLEWAEFVHTADTPSARLTALEQLVKSHDLEGQRCTSLIGIGEYNLMLVETPDVPASEMRQAVRWRVKDMIDFSVDEAAIDIFEVPSLRGGQDKLVYAVVAKSPPIRSLIKELSQCGVELETVDIPEFAIRNLIALMPEDVGGVAFIYLSEEVGLITITRQNALYLSRRFDYGRTRLLGSGANEVTPAVEGLLDAIVVEVQRSIDYYESHFGQPPVQGVVMAPLGKEFAGVSEYLGSQLGISTRVMGLAETIEMQTEVDDQQASECLCAIGAALRFGEAVL